jgi:Mrp family chromosome partitioning ATPase
VVREPGRTKHESATALREQLKRLDAPVLGVVVNKLKTPSGYGYGYYHQDEVAGLRIGDRS